MVTSWFGGAVAALLLMGAQRFFYKVAAERGCSTSWTTISFMATVTVISTGAFLFRGAPVPELRFLLLVSLANSLAFVIATVTHIEALKRLPAGIAYPLIRLDAVLVVLISLLFFNEQLGGPQGVGVILALSAALLFARDRGGQKQGETSRSGYLFIGCAILAGAAAAVSSRYAAHGTDKTAFMAVSYGLSTLFVLGYRIGPKRGDRTAMADSVRIGFVMGILNVAGYLCYLEALSRGPLSLVTAITSLHFMVAVILSILFYRERLTRVRLTGIILTMLALIFLHS